MAISFVAASAVAVAGSTTTASVNATATLPTGTASGDRVFICCAHTPDTTAFTTPTSWTLTGSATVGTGAIASAAGTRRVTVFHRDYDGVWTMPAVTLPSSSLPTMCIAAITLSKGATEVWDTPAFSSGSETVTGTAFTVDSDTALSMPTGSMVIATAVTNDNVTATVPTLTAPGVTFTGLAERADGGSANGNDASIKVHTASVTAGATAIPSHGLTLSAASDGGVGFVSQSLPVVTMEKAPPINRARFRAANW